MQAVNTNVLVRILVTDDKQMEQVLLARKFARKAKVLFITQIVQVELVWVLEAVYKFNKDEIIKVLQHMLTKEAFQSCAAIWSSILAAAAMCQLKVYNAPFFM